ncbi:MAG: hypothetical protein GF411_17975 [Candidatus Lokiarchaeota archaeon]|nr:hypothetical protein [Candidatus Lokiarchaeota archaeon]
MKRRIQPHLRVGEGDVEKFTLITGNPDRVPKIAAEMKDAKEIVRYRGFVTYRAYTPKGTAVTISGTGIGTPSTHICIEELANLGAKYLIRVGSCGGIDPSVKTGDVVVPIGCIRDERTSLNYAPIEFPAVPSPVVFNSLYSKINEILPKERVHQGICWTSDVYYAAKHTDQLDLWTRTKVKCIEMESSLLYTFAYTKGLFAGSILAVDGNLHSDPKVEQEDTSEESGEQHPLLIEAVKKEIQATVNAIDSIVELGE